MRKLSTAALTAALAFGASIPSTAQADPPNHDLARLQTLLRQIAPAAPAAPGTIVRRGGQIIVTGRITACPLRGYGATEQPLCREL